MVIEFEGNVGVHEKKVNGASTAHHGVKIGVPQAAHRKALLEVCRALSANRGGFTAPRINKRHLDWAPIMTWTIESVPEGKALAAELLPFMMDKKPLVELVLEFPEWDQAPAPVPSFIWHKRHALAVKSKRINTDEEEIEEEAEKQAPVVTQLEKMLAAVKVLPSKEAGK